MPFPHQPDAAPRQFPAAMRAIHWATALLIVAVVVLAWLIPEGPGKGGVLLMLHKSVGLTILALAAVRLIVRQASVRPPDEAGTSRLEALGAQATHVLLYVVLFAMPLSGYLFTAAGGHPVDVFGLFAIPPLVAKSETLRDVAWTVHGVGQYAVYGAVGLHVVAAFYHLLVRRDGVMARMWPGAPRLNPPVMAEARPAAR